MGDRRLGMAEAPGSNPGQSTFFIKKRCEFKTHIQITIFLKAGLLFKDFNKSADGIGYSMIFKN